MLEERTKRNEERGKKKKKKEKQKVEKQAKNYLVFDEKSCH